MDAPGDQSVGQKAADPGSHRDPQGRKKQTMVNALGAPVKQRMRGVGAIPTLVANKATFTEIQLPQNRCAGAIGAIPFA
ncbi:hypothetical protein HOY80DRAFT_1030657 [Tuber brumale]|nr:hypothetical protein HOY80DRAFT_1030657 [Tuber brumale]